jgi:L-rhamnose mutarotase
VNLTQEDTLERHAFIAQLNPGHRKQYIEAHRHVPPELLARYREAGIRNTSIFLYEDLLILYLECDDYFAAVAALEKDPSEIGWQKLMSPMLHADGYRECIDIFHME